MDIKVFGTGCAKCAEVHAMVQELAAAKDAGLQVCKVTDFREMLACGILATPAVSINGQVKCSGRIPAREEVAAWLDEACA